MAKFKVVLRDDSVLPVEVRDEVIEFEGTAEDLAKHSHIIRVEGLAKDNAKVTWPKVEEPKVEIEKPLK